MKLNIQVKEINGSEIKGFIGGFTFEAVVNKDNSDNGIDCGRISKMKISDISLGRNYEDIAIYDNRWVKKPRFPFNKNVVEELIEFLDWEY